MSIEPKDFFLFAEQAILRHQPLDKPLTPGNWIISKRVKSHPKTRTVRYISREVVLPESSVPRYEHCNFLNIGFIYKLTGERLELPVVSGKKLFPLMLNGGGNAEGFVLYRGRGERHKIEARFNLVNDRYKYYNESNNEFVGNLPPFENPVDYFNIHTDIFFDNLAKVYSGKHGHNVKEGLDLFIDAIYASLKIG